jgi:alanyl-tRNA synthetase
LNAEFPQKKYSFSTLFCFARFFFGEFRSLNIRCIPGLPKDRLYVTYFEGDPKENLDPDFKAKEIWKRYLPDDHILPGNKKDNFWEMGETGPCGPCSEVHFDRIGGRNAADRVNKDDPMVLEIWNLVFMAFNRETSGKLKPLPHKHVDTGMGFERLLSILQNKYSNYDTDVFTPIFEEIQKITGAPAYEGKLGPVEDPLKKDMAYRVVADHIRTLTFAVTDGALPGPTGRGYVLRRILRRAVRYGKEFLGAKPGFFGKLVNVVVRHFGEFFSELKDAEPAVVAAIQKEEAAFSASLDKGIQEFNRMTKSLNKGDVLKGEDVFSLYNSCGFPDDLTQLMAEEKGLTIDRVRFNEMLENLRKTSRLATKNKIAKVSIELDADAVDKLKTQKAPVTDDSSKYSIGLEDVQASVLALYLGSEKGFANSVATIGEDQVGVVLNKTNFYAESGGQIFDQGFLEAAGMKFEVDQVQTFGGYVLHVGRLREGEIKVGSTVTCCLVVDRRRPIMANHTSTHMVNFALREVLGGGIDQQGSVVTESYLRFDYSYGKAPTRQELEKIDRVVCDLIAKELKVYAKDIPLDTAKSISGIRAMFGEKYPNPVRVVSIGVSIDDLVAKPTNPEWSKYPIELCGGTHLTNVKEATIFAIISDDSNAQGVRRLVAVTGEKANKAYVLGDSLHRELNEVLALPDTEKTKRQKLNEFIDKVTTSKIPLWRKKLMAEEYAPTVARLQDAGKDNMKAQAKTAETYGPDVVKQLTETKAPFHVAKLELGGNREALASASRYIQENTPYPVGVLLISVDTSKVGKESLLIVANVHADLVAKGFTANDWCKAAAEACGGKAGGKPGVAQGAGPQFQKDAEVLAASNKYAQSKI